MDTGMVKPGYSFAIGQDMLSLASIDCVSTYPYYSFQNMSDLFSVIQTYCQAHQKPWFIEEFGYNQSTSQYR